MNRLAPLSDEEIGRRLPVWSIFSNIFLDTWFDDETYDRWAEQLDNSGYSIPQLETIMREEVAPAFCFNLLSVAGEWAGFHDDVIKERVLDTRGKRLHRLTSQALFTHYVSIQWEKFERRLLALDKPETE